MWWKARDRTRSGCRPAGTPHLAQVQRRTLGLSQESWAASVASRAAAVTMLTGFIGASSARQSFARTLIATNALNGLHPAQGAPGGLGVVIRRRTIGSSSAARR
jgi:hypothetical protein